MIERWFFVYYLSMALSIVSMHEKKNQFYILKEKIIRRITEIFNMIKCSLDHRLDYNMYCQVIVQFIDNLEVYQYILSLMWTILYFFLVKQKFGDNNKDSEVFVVVKLYMCGRHFQLKRDDRKMVFCVLSIHGFVYSFYA